MGFRSNPFRALTREEWSEIALIPPQIEAILKSNLTHLQIVGDQGAGKTSTLLALKVHFTNQGHRVRYHYLPLGESRFREDLRSIDILLLDEMQRLRKSQRSRLLRKIAPKDGGGIQLICSTHEDLTPAFERRDRPLTTVCLEQHEESFVREMIERRLEHFALDHRASVRFCDPAYRFLIDTYTSDLRSVERLLYAVFQQQELEGEITEQTLQRVLEEISTTLEQE
jgi:chromosomal replication initiation ATPase DnaA